MDINALLPIAIQAAEEASRIILEVYHSNDFQAEVKGDQSPLTRADRMAHQIIQHILEKTNLPVLSEEGRAIPYEERRHWEYFWMVDPLDGTKEFLKRNGDFTVNIALIHKGNPVLGVVAIPVHGDLYFGGAITGAFLKRNGSTIQLPLRTRADLSSPGLKVVASRTHLSEETEAFIHQLNEPELISRGSSLKFMLLAEGLADVYPRFAPTMEWDTAAAHAIVNAVGLAVLQKGADVPLCYNKRELLNPDFLAR